MDPDRPVTLAAIIGAHGVTGEVRLKLFGEGAAALKRYRVFGVSGSGGAFPEQLEPDLARHAVRADDGGERDGAIPGTTRRHASALGFGLRAFALTGLGVVARVRIGGGFGGGFGSSFGSGVGRRIIARHFRNGFFGRSLGSDVFGRRFGSSFLRKVPSL